MNANLKLYLLLVSIALIGVLRPIRRSKILKLETDYLSCFVTGSFLLKTDPLNYLRLYMKRYNKSFFSNFSFKWQDIVALLGRKSRRPLCRIIDNMIIIMGGHQTTSTTKGTYRLLTILHNICKTQGLKGLVKYAKSLNVVFMQVITGYHISDLGSLGPRFSRTRAGLPRALSPIWRREIRKGNHFYMKLTLTILNLYRVVSYPGELKLNTITDPAKYDVPFMKHLFTYIEDFADLTVKNYNISKLGKDVVFFPIYTSGPTVAKPADPDLGSNPLSNFSSSNFSVFRALQAIETKPLILEAMQGFATLYGLCTEYQTDTWLVGDYEYSVPKWDEAYTLTEKERETELLVPLEDLPLYKPFSGYVQDWTDIVRGFTTPTSRSVWPNRPNGPNERKPLPADLYQGAWIHHKGHVWEVTQGKIVHKDNNLSYYVFKVIDTSVCTVIGKLGTKDEPAGKIRVFAMVDPLTQWLLRPIHKVIFSFIKKIPMDGTFDQLKPIWRLLSMKVTGLFSFDLSSATDRLPVDLQEGLMSSILGPKMARHWRQLLVGREYFLGKTPLIYGAGQPMGALSSWAMLAWTHHFLVQVAAWRCGFPKNKLFQLYALLGDDIVIGHGAVAKEYLHIMKMIDVPINLTKSIVSRRSKGLEFAKRIIVDGVDVSPVPFREFSEASQNLTTFVQLGRKYQLTIPQIFKIMGYGYKVLGQSSLHVTAMKGRYKWVKVLMTFPSTSAELQTWLSNSVTDLQLWSLLQLERDRFVKWLDRDDLGWRQYAANEGFTPVRHSEDFHPVWWPNFTLAQSLVVSSRVVRTTKELTQKVNQLDQILRDVHYGIGPNLDPFIGFKLVMEIQNLQALLASSMKPRSTQSMLARPFKIKNRNNSLFVRWINKLRPPVRVSKKSK